MRLFKDGEDWSGVTVRASRFPSACVFCDGIINVGSQYARLSPKEKAHYRCAPGLGSPLYLKSEWTEAKVGISSLTGLRDENQDAATWLSQEGVVRLLVCDGMGGHRGGREAAVAAVASMGPKGIPYETVQAAHRAVLASGPGGTTFCMAEVLRTGPSASGEGRSVRFTQVGDSTARLYRPGKLGYEFVVMTKTQGSGHMVFACLGQLNRCVPDPIVTSYPALPGDLVVVHSDGVDPLFKTCAWERSIAPLLPDHSTQAIADAMTKVAIEVGSQDNATAIVFRVP